MIKGLIFDFDGVVIDSEGAEYQAWQELYGRYGRELPLSVWAQAIGAATGYFDAFGYLESLLGEPIADRETVKARRHRRYLDLTLALPVLPGVRQVIEGARELGLSMAVASSSDRRWVVGHLTRLGLIDSFSAVRTSEDVAQVKPNPALYLSALVALGLRPQEAIAIEDSPNGIAAARQAGLFVVAVPNPLTSQLPIDQAHLRLNALTDLPLAELISLAERAS